MDKLMLTPKDVYNYVEGVGVKKTKNSWKQSLFLGILAGMFIALGGFAAGASAHSIENYGLSKLVAGIVFPVGLMLVLICGAELFTGNCLLTIAFFEKKITLTKVLKNWVLVFVGNFIGAALIAWMLYMSGSLHGNHGGIGVYFINVAAKKVHLSFSQALVSGILCNIVVCLAVWGSYAAKTVVGKVFIGFFPIMAFVIAGFEHCVANMFYLTAGVFSRMDSAVMANHALNIEKANGITTGGIINNLIPVTIGNIIGGGILIAGLYIMVYSSRLQESEKKSKSLNA